MEQGNKKSDELKKNAYTDLFSQSHAVFLGKIFSLLFTIAFTRTFTPELFGSYNIILTLTMVCFMLIEAGVSSGILKYVTEELKKKNKPKAKGYLMFLFRIQLFMFLLFLVGVLAGIAGFAYPMIEGIDNAMLVMLGFLFFYMISETIITLSYIFNKVEVFTYRELGYGILRLILFGIAIALGMEYTSVYLVHMAAMLLTTIFVAWKMRAELKDILGSDSDYSFDPIATVSAIGHLTLSQVMTAIYGFVDIMILGRYVALGTIGIYKIANSLLNITEAFVSFYRVAQPILIKADVEEREKVTNSFTRTLLFLAVLFLWFVLGISFEMIKIAFGHAFVDSQGFFFMLATASGFWTAYSILMAILILYNWMWAISTIAMISGTINIVLDLILIPTHGAVGAAVATVASKAVAFIITLYFINKLKFKLDYKSLFAILIFYWVGFAIISMTIAQITIMDSLVIGGINIPASIPNLVIKALIMLTADILIAYAALRTGILDRRTIDLLMVALIGSLAKYAPLGKIDIGTKKSITR